MEFGRILPKFQPAISPENYAQLNQVDLNQVDLKNSQQVLEWAGKLKLHHLKERIALLVARLFGASGAIHYLAKAVREEFQRFSDLKKNNCIRPLVAEKLILQQRLAKIAANSQEAHNLEQQISTIDTRIQTIKGFFTSTFVTTNELVSANQQLNASMQALTIDPYVASPKIKEPMTPLAKRMVADDLKPPKMAEALAGREKLEGVTLQQLGLRDELLSRIHQEVAQKIEFMRDLQVAQKATKQKPLEEPIPKIFGLIPVRTKNPLILGLLVNFQLIKPLHQHPAWFLPQQRLVLKELSGTALRNELAAREMVALAGFSEAIPMTSAAGFARAQTANPYLLFVQRMQKGQTLMNIFLKCQTKTLNIIMIILNITKAREKLLAKGEDGLFVPQFGTVVPMPGLLKPFCIYQACIFRWARFCATPKAWMKPIYRFLNWSAEGNFLKRLVLLPFRLAIHILKRPFDTSAGAEMLKLSNLPKKGFEQNFLVGCILGHGDAHLDNLFEDASIDNEDIMPTSNADVERFGIRGVAPMRVVLAGYPQARQPFTRETLEKMAKIDIEAFKRYHNIHKKAWFSKEQIKAQIERLTIIKAFAQKALSSADQPNTPAALYDQLMAQTTYFSALKQQCGSLMAADGAGLYNTGDVNRRASGLSGQTPQQMQQKNQQGLDAFAANSASYCRAHPMLKEFLGIE